MFKRKLMQSSLLSLVVVILVSMCALVTSAETLQVITPVRPAEWLETYVLPEFSKKYPNVTVEISVPAGNYYEKLKVMAAGGTMPDVFLGLPGIQSSGDLIINKQTEPLDAYLEKSGLAKELVPAALPLFNYFGQQHGVAFQLFVQPWYYNRDMFTKLGLVEPAVLYNRGQWTWDDFQASVIKLSQLPAAEGALATIGAGTGWKNAEWIQQYIHQNGATIVDLQKGTSQWSSQKVIETLEFFQDLYYNRKALGARFLPAMVAGNTAMVAVPLNLDPSIVPPTFPVDMAPQIKNVERATDFTGTAFFITSASNKKDLAWAFIEVAMSRECLVHLPKMTGAIPTRLDALSSFSELRKQQYPDMKYPQTEAISVSFAVPNVLVNYNWHTSVPDTIAQALTRIMDRGEPVRGVLEELDRQIAVLQEEMRAKGVPFIK